VAADVITVTNPTSNDVPIARGILIPRGRSHVFHQHALASGPPHVVEHLAKAIEAGILTAVTFDGEVLTGARMRELGRGKHGHTHDDAVGADPVVGAGTSSFIEGPVGAAFAETLPAGDPFPTEIIWWTDATKTKRVADLLLTRDVEMKPTQERWRTYRQDGVTVAQTVTDTITYSGAIFEATRTRVVT